MLTQWVTVESWQNGLAVLRYQPQHVCGQCAEQTGCGNRLLNQLTTQRKPLLTLNCETPLVSGQQVELAIGENSLLTSAMLVYLLPLAGLFTIAALFQALFTSDLAAFAGALCGGTAGFLLAAGIGQKLQHRYHWQPVIIRIGAVPDSALPTHTSVNASTIIKKQIAANTATDRREIH